MFTSPFFTRTLSTGISVAAPLHEVWATLIDFATYPQWNHLLSNVESSLKPGGAFNFSIALDGKVLHRQSTLIAAIPNAELRWSGPRDPALRPLFSGNHYLKLFELDRTTTYVDHGETFSGLLLPALWPMLGSKLLRHYVKMNAELKGYVEEKA